jgi:hypothetical protein
MRKNLKLKKLFKKIITMVESKNEHIARVKDTHVAPKDVKVFVAEVRKNYVDTMKAVL